MLVIDTMVHLKSEIPIQCRAPVARSQLASRKNISFESLQATVVNNTVHDVTEASAGHGNSVHQFSLESRFGRQLASPPVVQKPVSPDMLTVITPAPDVQLQHSGYPSQKYAEPPNPRIPTCFGYDPTTAEHLITLSALDSKQHGETIGISKSLTFLIY